MCGIAGFISIRPCTNGHAMVRNMLSRLEARGPEGTSWLVMQTDGVAVWSTNEEIPTEDTPCLIALGCARLAINDTSTRGLQPIANDNESVWVTLNGEIFNFVELREILTAKSYRFRTGTDTEVIAHAYTEWGERCFEMFNGQFGIAILDRRRDILILARDRMGITPLFVRVTEEAISFASELGGILAGPGDRPTINEERLSATIGLPYKLHQRGNATLYADVLHVVPGEIMVIDARLGIRRTRFWNAATVTTEVPSRFLDARTRLQELYIDAVRKRLRTDRRFAFIVSGGIDSSSVVGIARTLFGVDAETFSLDLPDARFNENDSIREVITHNGMRSHLIPVTADKVARELPRLLERADEPLPSPNGILHAILADAIDSEGFRVVLNGVGGDEAFCGYHDHFLYYLRDLQRSGSPRFATEFAAWQRLQRRPSQTFNDFCMFLETPGGSYSPDFLARSRGHDYRACLHKDFRAAHDDGALFEKADITLREKLVSDLTRLTLPHALKLDDRCYMGRAVESRQPLLDHDLVEYGLSLPNRFRVHKGVSKYLLRAAVRPFVPASRRRDMQKIGLNLPIDRWMSGRLKPLLLDHLGDSDNPLFTYCDHDAVNRMLASHFDGEANHSLKIWDLINVNNWLAKYYALAKTA